jgi:hypothetical protein
MKFNSKLKKTPNFKEIFDKFRINYNKIKID